MGAGQHAVDQLGWCGVGHGGAAAQHGGGKGQCSDAFRGAPVKRVGHTVACSQDKHLRDRVYSLSPNYF